MNKIPDLPEDIPLILGDHIEFRGTHPELADRIYLQQPGREWSWRRYRNECVRLSHLLLRRLEKVPEAVDPHVAMLMDNHFETLALLGACGYAGLTLFGINSALSGHVLAGVINKTRASVIVTSEKCWAAELENVVDQLEHVSPDNILVIPSHGGEIGDRRNLDKCLEQEVGEATDGLSAPAVAVTPDMNLMVIYTSGTTGLPKGINNSHLKLLTYGKAIDETNHLTLDSVAYASMPLYHSNALWVSAMSSLWSGCRLVIRERFSASGFIDDALDYGITYFNYIGEPINYVLQAVKRRYGEDEEIIRRELTEHPNNRLSWSNGAGATEPDRETFKRWFGMDYIRENYGSTEGAILVQATGDDAPRGAVGEITDPTIKILGGDGRECAPARVDAQGAVVNYDEAVGEICKDSDEYGWFQGYFDDEEASKEKVRDGVYHSGDLGHVRVVNGKRYLYFDGRTGDWIRKDGENFSALQVSQLLLNHPSILVAASYGVPCAVANDLVMAALKLPPGKSFGDLDFYTYCENLTDGGGMSRVWIPDFVRIVDDFPYTQSMKIVTRTLRAEHFNPSAVSGDPLFWRERGDKDFKPLTAEDYDALRERFVQAERLGILEPCHEVLS